MKWAFWDLVASAVLLLCFGAVVFAYGYVVAKALMGLPF